MDKSATVDITERHFEKASNHNTQGLCAIMRICTLRVRMAVASAVDLDEKIITGEQVFKEQANTSKAGGGHAWAHDPTVWRSMRPTVFRSAMETIANAENRLPKTQIV